MMRLSSMLASSLIIATPILAQDEAPSSTPVPAPTSTEPPSANPASQDISLTVLAKGRGRPVKKAEVKVGDEVLYTDPQGKLSFKIPAQGDGKILISHSAHAKQFVEYSALRQNNGHATIYMLPGEPDDETIIVRGERRPEVSRKNITVQETTRVAPSGDPAQITKLLPGVQSTAFQPEVIIRGSGPYDSKYYVDDIEVPFIFHRIGNISVIPDQMLSDVEFSAGGFGPQYGNATGGVITLRTTSEVPETPKTEFRINVPMFSSLYHERPLSEDSSLALSVRRSYIDQVLKLVMPKSADITLVPYFQDAHVRYLKLLDDGHYKVLATLSEDGLKAVIPFNEADEEDGRGKINYRDRFASFGVERRKILSNGWSFKTTPQVSVSQTEFTLLNDYLKSTFTQMRLPTEFTKRLSKTEFLYLGFDPEFLTGTIEAMAPLPSSDPFFDYEDAPRGKIDRRYSAEQYAAWVAVDQAFGPVLLTPGLRGFYNGQIKKAGYDPRLGWRYKLTDEHDLKGAIGQYSINPQPQVASKEFGNPDIGYERSIHYVLGIESKWGTRWVTDFQVFHKRTFRLIKPDDDKRYTNQGVRLTNGAEVFIRRNLTEKFFGWLSYTYSTSKERKSEQDPLHYSDYDQTHVMNIAASYRVAPTWDLGTRISYASGRPYTPVYRAVYNSSYDKYQPMTNDSDINTKRMPDTQSIDIFATKDSLYDTWKLSYRFGVNYLALKPQVSNVSYNYDYSKQEKFQGLPPIPYFELRGEL